MTKPTIKAIYLFGVTIGMMMGTHRPKEALRAAAEQFEAVYRKFK